jgi:prophage maintenance system killer protein
MPEISIYQTESGAIEVRLDQDTVWVSQEQMSDLFGVQKAAISKHLKNIFLSDELDRTTTVSKMETVQREGGRSVNRRIEYFNLDAVISVGYRVNSVRATRFRQWATRTLREHMTQGYTLNRHRLEANARELEAAILLVRKAVQNPDLRIDAGRGLVEIIARYAQTFLLLQRYDDGLLTEPVQVPGGTLPTLDTARALVAGLKADLMARSEATSLFAQERDDAFAALLGNLDQTVFGEPAYPSVEAKAAHLLYFVIKNHPFADGNKRCGAFLFVEFLSRNGRLLGADGAPVLNDIGLAALALLVAESAPTQKETIIRLIMNMLSPGDAS